MLHLTAKNFQIEVKDTSLPVVVMFYAIWCGKCAMMKPVVEDIEKKYAGKIKFCEVEIEESAVLAAEYAPEIVPTIVLFKEFFTFYFYTSMLLLGVQKGDVASDTTG